MVHHNTCCCGEHTPPRLRSGKHCTACIMRSPVQRSATECLLSRPTGPTDCEPEQGSRTACGEWFCGCQLAVKRKANQLCNISHNSLLFANNAYRHNLEPQLQGRIFLRPCTALQLQLISIPHFQSSRESRAATPGLCVPEWRSGSSLSVTPGSLGRA